MYMYSTLVLTTADMKQRGEYMESSLDHFRLLHIQLEMEMTFYRLSVFKI